MNPPSDLHEADQGELVAIWNLNCLIERELPEVLDARYSELVTEYRASDASRQFALDEAIAASPALVRLV